MISVKTALRMIYDKQNYHYHNRKDQQKQAAKSNQNWNWYCGPNSSSTVVAGGYASSTGGFEMGENDDDGYDNMPEFVSDKLYEAASKRNNNNTNNSNCRRLAEEEGGTLCGGREEVDDDDTCSTASTTSSNSSNSKRRRNVSIRFSSIVTIHSVLSLSMYTRKERRRCWHSDAAIDKYTARRNEIVARMEAGKPPIRHTYRGLEWHTKQGSEIYSEHVDQVITAVLEEQDRQYAIGGGGGSMKDEELIRRASTQYSKKCAVEALHAARLDEGAAVAAQFTSLMDEFEDDEEEEGNADCNGSCFTEQDTTSVGGESAAAVSIEEQSQTSTAEQQQQQQHRNSNNNKIAKANTRRGRKRNKQKQLPRENFASKGMRWSGLFFRKYLVCH